MVSNPEEQERITAAVGGPRDPGRAPDPLLAVPRAVAARSCATSTTSTTDYDDDFVTVVVPEFALDHWWQQLLHNQSALVLRTRLRSRPNTVVTSVPFHLRGDQVEVGGR